jgi:hypothetical protein
MIKPEILFSPTISGSIDEVHFSAVGNCTWVRFSDDADCDDWCGVFGPGHSGRSAAVADAADRCFVIAGGQGYLIDVYSRELLHKSQHAWLTSVIAVPERDLCDPIPGEGAGLESRRLGGLRA